MTEPGEILKRAWEAVQEAGVPESMQDAAFREAVAILRDDAGGGAQGQSPGRQTPERTPSAGGKKTSSKASSTRKRTDTATSSIQVPDQATFFSDLSHESGVPETDLRDLLNLGSDGTVNVTPPTRKLGNSKAEQARSVVALVAAARLIGLKERPISAEAVRREVQRKNCFDTNNFGSKVIGQLDGFNYGGSRAEIVTTSKWVNEFEAAVDRAQGRHGDAKQPNKAKG